MEVFPGLPTGVRVVGAVQKSLGTTMGAGGGTPSGNRDQSPRSDQDRKEEGGGGDVREE